MGPMDALLDLDAARKRLEGLRERLTERRGALALEAGLERRLDESTSELSIADNHPADIGTETFEREKAVSMIDDIDRQLEDAEHALHRLQDGTYGICEGCGSPIPSERLEAQPAARFCVEDQQRFEREHRTP